MMTLLSLIYWWLRYRLDMVDYDTYLRSRAWYWRRNRAKRRAGGKCQLGAHHGGPFDTHHNSYEHLGAERQSDLVYLCRACHALYHGRERR